MLFGLGVREISKWQKINNSLIIKKRMFLSSLKSSLAEERINTSLFRHLNDINLKTERWQDTQHA